MAFKADGTAYRLKGRILRHLDNEPVTDADKSNIRDTLGITGTNGDLLAANNLDDVASKDTAKLNLEIPSVGSGSHQVPTNGHLGDMSFQSSAAVTVDDLTVDGQLTAAVGKPMPVNGPTMRFDGSNDYIEFADNDSFSFVDGSGNDTPFSISAWVKMEDATSFPVISKLGAGASLAEYMFGTDGSDRLQVAFMDSSGQLPQAYSSAVTNYEGQWIHLVMTYGGAGPSSSSGKSFATSITHNVSIYVNAAAQALTAVNKPAYSGMSSTAQPVSLGSQQTNYAKGEIRDVKLFNKELSAAEVKEVYSNGQLGDSFAESTGRSLGAIDETSGLASWSGAGSIVPTNLTETANTTVGGRANVLKEEATASGGGVTTRFYIASAFDMGKRIRIEFDYYLPSTNATIDKLEVFFTSGSTLAGLTVTDTWTRASIEAVVGPTSTLQLAFYDGGAFNPTAGDFIALDNFAVTQIGSVLDARAENYNQSAGKLLDVSGNDFVGTQSGGVELLTPRSHLSAGTLDLTNLPTSATGLSAGEVYNDSGTLKIV
ncbi:LamG domain-containing protein [Verrucomicrobia bacterium]|nr:LamG domain-containing protein [Verrucomicrobiota bacterium]